MTNERKPSEAELWRWIHGELPAERAAELDRRALEEPDLAARRHRLEDLWQGLELPPPAPVPVGFRGRVMAHWESRHRPAPLPGWVRAAGAAALAAGIALGAGLGALPQEVAGSEGSGEATAFVVEDDGGLAEDYWQLLEDLAEDDRG